MVKKYLITAAVVVASIYAFAIYRLEKTGGKAA